LLAAATKIVHALDAATGKEVWSFAARARIDSSPPIVDGREYIGSNDGRLYVLDLAKLSASPAVGAGRLVIGNQDRKIFCLTN
jgi:glucose dehydrogenase